MTFRRLLFVLTVLLIFDNSYGQLKVTGGISNPTFSNYLFGAGVKITNLTFNCSGANQYGTFNAQFTQLGIDSGILISTGTIQEAIGPDNQCCASVTVGTTSTDACVNAALGSPQSQYDPCIIEFDIVPQCDTFNVTYVFGSEEYNTGIGGYNDVFGFFVSGPNPLGGSYACQDFALIPGTNTPVTINNVNFKTNTAYYRDNHTTASNLYNDFQPNGLTVPLTATIPVVACQSYHMKVAVVDIGNPLYDSWVFLKFKSLSCAADQVLSVNLPDTTVCNGSGVILSATGGSNYTWSPGTGLSSTTGATVTATPTVTTTYTVSADMVGACIATDSVVVNVAQRPKVNFVPDTMSGCPELCVQFYDSTSVIGGIKDWTWNFGDGSTSTIQNPIHCYNTPGKYGVTLGVTSNAGCAATKSVPNMITVYQVPNAAFTYSPTSMSIADPVVNFTDESTDVYGISAWFWTFGDTGKSLQQNPTHTYSTPGTFCATLAVTNKHGCIDTTTHCIDVEPQYYFWMPDAFSPNGDGRNDVFGPKGEGITTFEMWIFDRWGQQIYHCTDMNKPWDGKVQNGSGAKCQEDTYVWLVELTDAFGNDRRYIGSVTIVR